MKFGHSTEERHRCSIFAVPSFNSIGQLSTGVVFAENPVQSVHRCWPCYKQQRRYNRARYGLGGAVRVGVGSMIAEKLLLLLVVVVVVVLFLVPETYLKSLVKIW